MKIVRIGTRSSALAMAQAREVKKKLKKRFPAFRFKLVTVKTTGDQFQTVELFRKTNIGVFTKELERKLLSGEIDIAVHSLKDLPTVLPKGLFLAAFPKRRPRGDMLISRRRHTLSSLPNKAVVGTGSPRRRCQLLRLRPDLNVVAIRGNLDTRVGQVIREKKLDAVVLAQAGLLRLKKYLKYARPIPAETLLPAVGQAALGIEIRESDAETLRLVWTLDHTETRKEVLAERYFLNALGGGCRVPVGILSKINDGTLTLKAAVFSTKNSRYVEEEIRGPVSRYLEIAEVLAKRLIRKGAAKFMKDARR